MKLSTSLIALLLSANVSQASYLEVYQDKTFYRYVPTTTFIGFSQRIQAKCEGSSLGLRILSTCAKEDRLCRLLTDVQKTEYALEASVATGEVLEKLIALPKPSKIEASSWIKSAKLLGEEQSRLAREQKQLQTTLGIAKSNFSKQAPSQQAQETSTLCKDEMELSIPYGFVSFSTRYEADMKEDDEISVTQYLSIVNRSGIDIEAQTAMFYYRAASQALYPTHFSPWIVRKYTPRAMKKRMKPSKNYRQEVEEVTVSMSAMQSDMPVPAPTASYEDAREYKIKNLSLPSTGIPLELPVLTWKSKLSCEVRAYPYMKSKAFHVCSFKPKFQIDSNAWKVKSGSKVMNEKARGEYAKGEYDIYTQVEEDIKIERKVMVQKERETGIFGGTARKKDGFSLTLTNKSSKAKTLRVIERIPTSTSEEIKVKLLEVKSDKKVDYKMLKNGKIEMQITLAANETKKIDIVFEISYDKELKVKY